jgi:hypothetical protein
VVAVVICQAGSAQIAELLGAVSLAVVAIGTAALTGGASAARRGSLDFPSRGSERYRRRADRPLQVRAAPISAPGTVTARLAMRSRCRRA